ncbi:hypothetical protein R1sor_016213 [Riccia sorocarpa]|uniref:Transmembrane protein n=1 Tax=Riccia sorocarpa TaxID=122646 RepID=A0ABD3HID6_9MARC
MVGVGMGLEEVENCSSMEVVGMDLEEVENCTHMVAVGMGLEEVEKCIHMEAVGMGLEEVENCNSMEEVEMGLGEVEVENSSNIEVVETSLEEEERVIIRDSLTTVSHILTASGIVAGSIVIIAVHGHIWFAFRKRGRGEHFGFPPYNAETETIIANKHSTVTLILWDSILPTCIHMRVIKSDTSVERECKLRDQLDLRHRFGMGAHCNELCSVDKDQSEMLVLTNPELSGSYLGDEEEDALSVD